MNFDTYSKADGEHQAVHVHRKQDMQVNEKVPYTNGDVVLFSYVLLMLLALAWVRHNHYNRLILSFKAFVSGRMIRQLLREDSSIFRGSSLLLFLNFTGSLSFVLVLFVEPLLAEPINRYVLWSYAAVSLLVLYTLKWIMLKGLQFILELDDGVDEYLGSIFLYSQIGGIVFLPCLIGAVWGAQDLSEICVKMALILFILLLVYRFIRLIVTGLQRGISKFYLFSYLCSLEILPLLVLCVGVYNEYMV